MMVLILDQHSIKINFTNKSFNKFNNSYSFYSASSNFSIWLTFSTLDSWASLGHANFFFLNIFWISSFDSSIMCFGIGPIYLSILKFELNLKILLNPIFFQSWLCAQKFNACQTKVCPCKVQILHTRCPKDHFFNPIIMKVT